MHPEEIETLALDNAEFLPFEICIPNFPNLVIFAIRKIHITKLSGSNEFLWFLDENKLKILCNF